MKSTSYRGCGWSRASGLMIVMATLGMSSPPASAAVVYTSGTVISMHTYPDFGSGDFIFRLSTHIGGCEGGFWISPSQPGFKTTVAAVMLARTTGESITVGGDNAQIWNGSASAFCKVSWVTTP
jgi:hypothetical protein